MYTVNILVKCCILTKNYKPYAVNHTQLHNFGQMTRLASLALFIMRTVMVPGIQALQFGIIACQGLWFLKTSWACTLITEDSFTQGMVTISVAMSIAV